MVTLQVKANGQKVWRTNGVYLGGRRVLTVAHYRHGLPEVGDVEFVVNGILVGIMSVEEFRTMGVVCMEGVDLIAFDGPKSSRTFKRITCLFDNQGYVPTGAVGGYLVNHSVCDTVSFMSLKIALVDSASAGIQYSANGAVTQTMDSGLVYEYTKGGPGFCGTLALHNSVIIGMHVAGCPGVRGYAVGLSRTDANYMYQTPLHATGCAMPNPQHVLQDNMEAYQVVSVIDNCSLPVVGKEFDRIKGPVGPNLVDQFEGEHKVPASTGWEEVGEDGATHKMLDDMIAAGIKSRNTLASLGGDQILLDVAIDCVTDWHMDYLKTCLTAYEPYSLSTCITGYTPAGDKVMEPLDLNKSHGLSSSGPSCVKRSQVITVSDDGVVDLHPSFKSHYDNVLAILKRTGSIQGLELIDRTAKTAPKIELVSDAKKLRSFYGSPAIILYIARQYLGPLVGAWKKDPVGTGTGAGLAPSSIDWDKIQRIHNTVCTKVLSADVRKWDKCLLTELRECVRVLLMKVATYYDLSTEDRNVFKALGEYYSGPHMVALAGLVLELRNLWPSGLFGTTQFGSVIHQVAQVYGICKSTGRTTPDSVSIMTRHLRESGAIYYSDDSVLPMTEYVNDGWSTSGFQQAMGTLGITLSSATDKNAPPCLVPLSDASFIARTFVPAEDGTVLAPLSIDSMFSCTEWRHSGVTDGEHMASVIPCIYAELIMHGPDTFHRSVERLRKYAAHFGLADVVPNYEWKAAWTRMRRSGEFTLLCGEPAPVTRNYVVAVPESGVLANAAEVGQRLVPGPDMVQHVSASAGTSIGKFVGNAAKKFVTSAATSALTAFGMSKPYAPPSSLIGAIGALEPTSCNATGEFTGTVLSVNPQALAPSGAPAETSTEFLGSRRVMMHKAQWSAIDASGAVLITDLAITPCHSNSVIVGTNHQLSLHPAAAAVLPSSLYTYDYVTLTFVVVTPVLMAGSLIATVSGSASNAGSSVMTIGGSFTPTGVLYMDIGATNEFSITLPWTSVYPMLRPCVSDRTTPYLDNYRAFPLSLTLAVQQPLRNTIVAGTGTADVYMSMEFKGLRTSNRRTSNLERIVAVAESGLGEGILQTGSGTRSEVTPTQVVPGTPAPVFVPSRYPGEAADMRPRGSRIDEARLSRWTLLANYTISGTPGLVGVVSLPGDLLASPPIQNLLNYNTFLCTKMRVMVQVRSTASQQGLVIASVIPTGLMAGDEIGQYVSDFTRATTFQHARLLLGGCREATIDLDWSGLLPHYQLGGAAESLIAVERAMVGYELAFTLPSPVTNSMGGDATAEVSVYAMMVDAELAIPNTFTIVEPQSGLVDTTVGLGAGLAPDQDTGESKAPAVPAALDVVPYKGLYFGGDNVLDVISHMKASHYTATDNVAVTLQGSFTAAAVDNIVPWIMRPQGKSALIWNFLSSWFSYSRGSMSYTMCYPSTGFSNSGGVKPVGVLRFASLTTEYTALDIPIVETSGRFIQDDGLFVNEESMVSMENGCAFYTPEVTRASSVIVPYIFPTAWVYMPPASVSATQSGHKFPAHLPAARFTTFEQYNVGGGHVLVYRPHVLCFHGCDDYELSGLRPLIGYGMSTADMTLMIQVANNSPYTN